MSNINNLITDFSVEQLKQFFRSKLAKFKPIDESYDFLFEDKKEILDNFTDIIKIGETELNNNDELLVITAKTNKILTNRTGKKRQYEIAKTILKEENNDAAFFIFYDENNNFRFSFIRANFLGTKRDFTNFKRYTYFVSKQQTNKTFISQISKADFKDLDSIQDAFSVEPLTKQFYEKLQHWYFWAIDNVRFPEDAEKEKNGREIAIIRLITRLIFIWFMKVRNLIPENLFDEENINSNLNNFAEEDSTYYKAILQNLFFATLNTKQVERKFRSEERYNKGYNADFGNQNVFRYHDLFKDPESLKTLFEKIPFLNGGLFECLDYKTKDKDERKYIDGFTATKGQQPIVPNFLFFSEIKKKDISKFYGKKNRTYEVEGLINLLKSYNFTIDENEADDIEVALDPELLGSIFENLLASYNPETSTTARKATGSFYTPREIVNYMTNESLKQYFLTHLNNTEQLDADLDKLIKYQTNENPFDEMTSKTITKLIDDLRVVDPAVGSGAFPMAVLNRLVFILSKIDPENTFWKNSQITGIKKSVSDPVIQRKLIEQIERQFQEKNADYGRKLYLIEKCIYGVDIQQIAVEIAKLRFFISLLVDEKINWDEPENNYGIEPLPNLDFKLMQGNSLISSFAGIDFDKDEKCNEDSLFDMDEANTELIQKFEELKNEYQNESEKEKKDKLRDKIENCIFKIVEDKIAPQLRSIEEKYAQLPNQKILIDKKNKIYITKEEAIAKDKQQLGKKLGYDIMQIEKDLKAFTEGRKPKDFFLWKIYFAEVFQNTPPRKSSGHPSARGEFKSGFDIVIGNPPYGAIIPKNQLEKIKSKLKDTKNSNSAAIFIDYAKNSYINQSGTLSFIIPKSLLYSEKWLPLAKSLSEYTSVLVDVEVAFDNVLLEQVLFVFNKARKEEIYKAYKFKNGKFKYRSDIKTSNIGIFSAWICDVSNKELEIASKIRKKIVNLCMVSETKRGIGLQKYLQSSGEISVIGGKEISRYKINGIKGYLKKNKLDKRRKKIEFLKQKKIVSQDLIAHIQNPNPHIKITAMIDKGGILIGMDTVQNTVIDNDYFEEFILSLLNSKFINWYTYKFIYCSAIRTMHFDSSYIGKIPILKIPKLQQESFKKNVDQIISKKELGEDTKELEDKIDVMVYKLYELTYEEVRIVDPEFWLSKEEYDNYE